jgi:hypothetical protein
MKRSLLLAMLLGCGTAQPTLTGPAPAPQALLEQVRKAHAGPQTMTCDAKAFVQAPKDSGRYELHISVKRPDSIRIEALTPVGDPAAVLVAAAGRFALLDLRGSVYYRGPATPQNLSRLIPVPMTPAELVSVLTGAIPELPGAQPSGSKREGEGTQLTFVKQGSSQQVSVGTDLRVTQVRRLGDQDNLLWAVKLDQHDDASGAQLPMLLHLDAPGAGTQLDLRLRNVATGKEPPAAAFSLAVPQGVRVEEVQ